MAWGIRLKTTKRKKLTKRKKQQIRRAIVLVLAGGIVAASLLGMLFSVGSFVYHHYFAEDDTLDYGNISVKIPNITEDFLTPNVNSRPGDRLEKVRGIVVHYTANPGTDAKANRDYFESRKDKKDIYKNKVSSHFIIGLDGKTIQCIPLDEIAYASNDRNQDTISIECCHPDKTGKFTRETYESLVRLCMWLCSTYQLEKDSIIRHYDVTGKLCPKYYVKHEKAWERLKDTIWERLSMSTRVE